MDRREEILDAAQQLYEEVGFEKTTVGDIARHLGMSPANLYRSFANRQAIDEAIAGRALGRIEDAAWEAARAKGTPEEVLERLALTVHRETRRLLFSHERMHRLCAIAARHRWPVVERYLERLHSAVRHVVETGQQSGAFRRSDPDRTARTIGSALSRVWHPYMIEIFQDDDLEAATRELCRLIVNGLHEK